MNLENEWWSQIVYSNGKYDFLKICMASKGYICYSEDIFTNSVLFYNFL